MSALQKLFSEKTCFVSILQVPHGKISLWKNMLFTFIMHPVVTEIISALQKLFSEKNALSLNSTAAAWQKYFCENTWFFLIIMHQKLYLPCRIYYQQKNTLSLNSTAPLFQWNNREYFFMAKSFLHSKRNGDGRNYFS